MNVVFKAEKMLERVRREGKAEYLTDEIKAQIKALDGKEGTTSNWRNRVYGEDVVWIPRNPLDGSGEGVYVALCDCDER